MPLLLISRLDIDPQLMQSGPYPKVMAKLFNTPYTSTLYTRYSAVFRLLDYGYDIRLRVYLDRFFNENGDVVKEYKQLFILPLVKISLINYYVDFTDFHLRDGIPIGYYVYVILMGFVYEENGETHEVPIFPNEFLIENSELMLPENLSRALNIEKTVLERAGKEMGVIALLYQVGLNNIAADLFEALRRFYASDYEGAIKFFRKVVEGLRNFVQNSRLEGLGESRQNALLDYLKKAYHLLSNFGEHSGTYGFMPEAELSKDIAISSCKYLITYLNKGPSQAIQIQR